MNPKMNAKIKEKWITALRNGEYQQGKGQLKNDKNEFCCLGVLCDLYAKETNNGAWDLRKEENYYSFITNTGTKEGLPPEQVIKWAGLPSNNPCLKVNDVQVQITTLNDKESFGFKGIANFIEAQL